MTTANKHHSDYSFLTIHEHAQKKLLEIEGLGYENTLELKKRYMAFVIKLTADYLIHRQKEGIDNTTFYLIHKEHEKLVRYAYESNLLGADKNE